MEHLSFVVLAGPTGSGKTRLLRYLKAENFQVLDLEHFARHRGSAFGALFQGNTRYSQQVFLEALSLKFSFFNKELPVVTEWKGRKIGSLEIPDLIYKQLLAAPKIWINRNKELRIKELLEVYQDLPLETLYKGLFSLRSKFRKDNFEQALQALKEKDRSQFVKIMLSYYDNRPEYRVSNHPIVKKIDWTTQPIGEITQDISIYLRRAK